MTSYKVFMFTKAFATYLQNAYEYTNVQTLRIPIRTSFIIFVRWHQFAMMSELHYAFLTASVVRVSSVSAIDSIYGNKIMGWNESTA